MRWRRVFVLIGLIAVGIGIALGLWWNREVDRFNRQAAYYNCLGHVNLAVQLNTHVEDDPIRFVWRNIGPSPNGRYLAGSTYQPGKQESTLFVDDLVQNTRIQTDWMGRHWSPDSRYMYGYTMDEATQTWHLQFMNPQGEYKRIEEYAYVLGDHTYGYGYFLIRFSPDAKYFAFWKVDDAEKINIYVVSTADFQMQTFTIHNWQPMVDYEEYWLSWLPTGHRLVVNGSGQFAIINVDQAQVLIRDMVKYRFSLVYQTHHDDYVYAVHLNANDGVRVLTQVFLLDEDLTLVSETDRVPFVWETPQWPTSFLYKVEHDGDVNNQELWRFNFKTNTHTRVPVPAHHRLLIVGNDTMILARRDEQTELVELRNADGTEPQTLLSAPYAASPDAWTCAGSRSKWLFYCSSGQGSQKFTQWFYYDGTPLFEGEGTVESTGSKYVGVSHVTKYGIGVDYDPNDRLYAALLNPATGELYPILDETYDWTEYHQRFSGNHYPLNVYASPDQEHFLVKFDRQLYQFSPADGAVTLLYDNVVHAILSPDRMRVAIYISEPDLDTHDVFVREMDGSKLWKLGTFPRALRLTQWTQCGGILAKWRDDRAAIRLN